jgi:hypothetical protein
MPTTAAEAATSVTAASAIAATSTVVGKYTLLTTAKHCKHLNLQELKLKLRKDVTAESVTATHLLVRGLLTALDVIADRVSALLCTTTATTATAAAATAVSFASMTATAAAVSCCVRAGHISLLLTYSAIAHVQSGLCSGVRQYCIAEVQYCYYWRVCSLLVLLLVLLEGYTDRCH